VVLPDLDAIAWLALCVGSISVGISKTGLPGSNTVGIALFAGAVYLLF